ncbi:MAG TPA: ABC transporter ATP-binding protein [Gemmatimonadales bacterium]|nr:ABC transporter ATP-binding protein [Gemmatimonadales bacterium]
MRTRGSLSRFLAYLRPYRGVVALATLFGVIRYLIPLALPWTVKVLVDDFFTGPAPRPPAQLHLLMAGLVALYIVFGVVSYWRSYLAGVAGHRLVFDLRRDLYQHVQRMSVSFFERQRIGEVVARMTSDIASAQNFVGAAFVNTAMDLASIVAIMAVLAIVHWKLALVAIAVLPCYAVMSHRLTRRIRQQSRMIHDQLEEISGELHEQVGAISTIQSFTQEEAEARAFERQDRRYLRSVLVNVRLQSVALGVTGFLTALGPILVLWFGAGEVLAGRLSVGALMAFYGYLGMLFQPVQRLTELNLILSNSRAAMDRIFEVFDTYPNVQERPGASELGRARGDIAFEDVAFRYDGGPPVLEGIELRIPPGKTAALVGPSGAGKSTLVKLLSRFYDVTAGRITIDGVDIRDLTLKSLRQNVAIVAQDPILLSGSISENLRYGRPEASEAEVREAARLAFASEFIERLPDGYDTEIGERGLRLSGGEKQRLAIARAFLKDAPILVLDEPTSALDPEAEALIKQALAELLRNRTAVIIAHRLSTIERADEVIVLDRGRIVERGPHQALIDRGGLYSRYVMRGLRREAFAS